MDNATLTRLRKLSQAYAYTSIRMHETVARKAGLSGTDHKYLGFLMEKGQLTAGELATITGLTTGAVTGLIDRFEKKELVKREFAADDRRKVIIVADTPKIMALLEPLYRKFRRESQELMATFSAEEVTVLERYFQQAIALMQHTTDTLNTND
jgi:DNA-binding MarR family transcriptional regulator